MLRYLAISAVLVLGTLLVILGIPYASAPRGTPAPRASHPRYVDDGASPRAGRDPDDRTPEPVTGAAPWALSAVPECLRERVAYTGSAAFVRAHLPRDARLVLGPARLTVADCTIDVRGAAVTLTRGETRLAVPPPARLYLTKTGVALAETAGSRDRLRVYALAPGTVRRLAASL